MKVLIHLLFAISLTALFVFAGRYEQLLPGDQEWAIYYGLLFVLSLATYILTKGWRAILIISALAPLSAMGMFFFVNIVFSLITSGFALLLAVGIECLWGVLFQRISG